MCGAGSGTYSMGACIQWVRVFNRYAFSLGIGETEASSEQDGRTAGLA